MNSRSIVKRRVIPCLIIGSAIVTLTVFSSAPGAADWWPFGSDKIPSLNVKDWLPAGKATASVNVKVDSTPLDKEPGLTKSYAPIISKASPSVVNVFSTRIVRQRSMQHFDDPIFRHFFGDRFDFPNQRPQSHKQQSLGSGVIVITVMPAGA